MNAERTSCVTPDITKVVAATKRGFLVVYYRGNRQVASESYDLNGVLFTVPALVPDGVVRQYYGNGTVKEETEYEDGCAHGKSTKHPGRREVRGKYVQTGNEAWSREGIAAGRPALAGSTLQERKASWSLHELSRQRERGIRVALQERRTVWLPCNVRQARKPCRGRKIRSGEGNHEAHAGMVRIGRKSLFGGRMR
jgi:hypothetical protein